MKKQLVQFNFPGMTAQQYEQVMDELRKTGHSDIPGRIHHVSAVQGNSIQVLGIWESREAFDNFGKIVQPIFEKFGVPQVQPTITSVYYEYSGVVEGGNQKKQLIQFTFPGLTERKYDQVWNELRRAGHATPSGLIHHVSVFQDNNCLVFDIWESQKAFDRFGKILMPILYKVGIDEAQPKITPVLNEFSSVESKVVH